MGKIKNCTRGKGSASAVLQQERDGEGGAAAQPQIL